MQLFHGFRYQIFSMLAVILHVYNPKPFSLSIACALLFIRKKDLDFYENYKSNFSNVYNIDKSEQFTTISHTHGLQYSESPFKYLYAACTDLFSWNTEDAITKLSQRRRNIINSNISSQTDSERANISHMCFDGLLKELPEYESILAQVAFAAAFSVDTTPPQPDDN